MAFFYVCFSMQKRRCHGCFVVIFLGQNCLINLKSNRNFTFTTFTRTQNDPAKLRGRPQEKGQGAGRHLTKFYTWRLRPEFQTLNLLYPIFWTPFTYCEITIRTPPQKKSPPENNPPPQISDTNIFPIINPPENRPMDC